MISDLDAMAAATRALQLGAVDSASELENLSQAAQYLADTAGITTTEALNKLIEGIGRTRAATLETTGVIVDNAAVQAEANRIMAENPGITQEMAMRQALLNTVLAQGSQLADQFGQGADSMADNIEQLTASIDDLKLGIGEWLANGLNPAINGVEGFYDATGAAADRVKQQAVDLLKTSGSWQEYNEAVQDAIAASGLDPILNMNTILGLQASLLVQNEEQFNRLQSAVKNAAAAEHEAALEGTYTALVARELAEAEADAAAAAERSAQAHENLVRAYEDAIARQQELAGFQLGALDAVGALSEEASQQQAIFQEGAAALQQAGLSASEYRDAIYELGLATGVLTPAQIALSQAVGILDQALKQGILDEKSFAAAMAEAAGAADPLAAANAAVAESVAALNDKVTEYRDTMHTVPDEVDTQFDAATEQAQAEIAMMKAKLDALHDKTIIVNVHGVVTGDWGPGGMPATTGGSGAGPGGAPTPVAQTGTTSALGGPTLVGERGPELVELPRGAVVYDAQKTARMLAGGNEVSGGGLGGDTYNILINATIYGVTDGASLLASLEREARAQGYDFNLIKAN